MRGPHRGEKLALKDCFRATYGFLGTQGRKEQGEGQPSGSPRKGTFVLKLRTLL
jgi:hypothetical protein